jgi:hypothetical protein
MLVIEIAKDTKTFLLLAIQALSWERLLAIKVLSNVHFDDCQDFFDRSCFERELRSVLVPKGTCYVFYNSDSCMDGVFEAFQHHTSDSCWSEHRHYPYQMYFSNEVNRSVFELINAQRHSSSSVSLSSA